MTLFCALSNDLDNVRTDLGEQSTLANDVMDVSPDALDWETGRLNPSSGQTASSAGYVRYNNSDMSLYFCRTKAYLPDDIISLNCKGTYYPVLFAYDSNDEFVGIYTDGIFDKVAIFLSEQKYYIGGLRKSFPTYKFRLIVCDASITTQPTVSDIVANVGYIYKSVTEKALERALSLTVEVNPRWENGKLSSTGQNSATGDSTNLRSVEYIESKTGEIIFEVPNGYICRYYLYDNTKTFQSYSSNIRNTIQTEKITKGYFIRVSVWNTTLTDITSFEGSLIKIRYAEPNRDAVLDFTYHQADYAEVGMFPKIGVIGDSFASGVLYNPLTGVYTSTNYNISWPQIMGRKEGVDVTNFTEGGLYTKTWLEDTDHGLPALLADEAQNLYIISLGINDARAITDEDMSLGSISDINLSDYTQNQDSFYGNYGRIIGNILAHAPKAKIICLSVARTGQRHMDTYIKEIASAYNVPYVDLTDDDYFTSPMFESSIVNGHPLAYGYAGMATAIIKLIKKCIVENLYYFSDYDGQVN